MKTKEVKEQFVQAWGVLGTQWGINRSMAQIHAYLLMSREAVATEEIMDALQLSRGNVNMNMRELMNWNLVYKQTKAGDRKEYFMAEHDIWKIAIRITAERKKRELMPAQHAVRQLSKTHLEGDDNQEQQHIKAMLESLDGFLEKMDTLSELMLKSEQSFFFKTIMKLVQ